VAGARSLIPRCIALVEAMPIRRAWRRGLALASLPILFSFSCTAPTDLSPGIWVTIESTSPVLLRGAQAPVLARVWRPGPAGDSIELHNVALFWATADPLIATVESGAQGRGRVTGVNSGNVEIRAVVPAYENAAPAILTLRVANPLEIDSIAPDTVRYGERVTMFGIGVGDLFFAGLGSGFLISDSLSIAGDKSGLGRQSFWVPWPALSGSIIAAGSGQLIAARDTTIVLPWDLYEPNEATPTDIALDGVDPFPPVPSLRFFNPALAFEDRRDFPFGFDWYRLRGTDLDTPVTVVFSAPALAGAYATFLTDRLRLNGVSDSSEWKLGSGEHMCKGHEFRPEQALSDTVVIALARLPASSVDLVSLYVQEGRYLLGVFRGYGTADARLAPDAYEENDICNFADDNFAAAPTRIDLGVRAFGENLTIDNPHDIDWFRVRVPGIVPQPVAIRTAGQPFTAIDRSDIDVYVLNVPSSTQALALAGADVARGSTSTLNLVLSPGDYYVAVVDSVGMATRYSLCMAIGTTCALPSPVTPSLVAAREAALLRPIAPYLARPRRDPRVTPERR
jgi:hypothetical protein